MKPKPSSLARLFKNLLLQHGIERPIWLDYVYYGQSGQKYSVDVYLPNVHVAFECDGPHHRDPAVKSADAMRQLDIEATGLPILRLSLREINDAKVDPAPMMLRVNTFIAEAVHQRTKPQTVAVRDGSRAHAPK